ncbi:hypothetical protein ACFFWB_13535 [Flavobacterium procerum]
MSCKSKPINQKIDKKKEGVWIDVYSQDGTDYKSYEYYKNDIPVKNGNRALMGKSTKQRNTKTESVL